MNSRNRVFLISAAAAGIAVWIGFHFFAFGGVAGRAFEPTEYPWASWAAGTLIAAPEGPMPIEEIPAGGYVLTLDSAGNRIPTMVVSAVVRTAPEPLLGLSGTDFLLELTPSHLLAIRSGATESRGRKGPLGPRGDAIQWIAAADVDVGDVLYSDSGAFEIVEKSAAGGAGRLVYNLTTDSGSYLLADTGIFSSDSEWTSPAPRDESGSDGSSGGCFPAGTVVQTPKGPTAIETLRPGDSVFSMDPKTGRWDTQSVMELREAAHSGSTVIWRTGGHSVGATANHPVFIAADGLDNRPRPDDVPPDEEPPIGGRWIAAGDLRMGDRLMGIGGLTVVDGIDIGPDAAKVYNITVSNWSNYAVGSDGILVHNKGSAEEELFSYEDYGGIESEKSGEEAEPTLKSVSPTGDSGQPSVSGLRAGFADDNKQFSYFLKFLEEYGSRVAHEVMAIDERIVIRVEDSAGKSVPNARLSLSSEGRLLERGLTLADGTWAFYPLEHPTAGRFGLEIESDAGSMALEIDRQGPRLLSVVLSGERRNFQRVPLDIVFVLDTTGSMGEEIQRLKQTIGIIHMNLVSLSTRPEVRFGLVLYRDRGDDYLTRIIPLTSDVEAFQNELDAVEAGGGGDSPEDLEAAMEAAVRRLAWTPDGIRLGFVITDAAPHLDYAERRYTYVDAATKSRRSGIKFHTVGTGGLAVDGEYVLRQLAQYTGGRYIFLTYGERGESEGGAPGSVSHHTGANWSAENLETIIIRFAKEELGHLTDLPRDDENEWWSAEPKDDRDNEDVLAELFTLSLTQLLDYSALRVDGGTAALIPFSADPPDEAAAEYLSARALLALKGQGPLSERLRLTDRTDLQDVLDELELQLTGLTAQKGAAKIGEILGAEVLIIGNLHRRDGDIELFLKLVRTQTAEILSLTRIVIDRRLLP